MNIPMSACLVLKSNSLSSKISSTSSQGLLYKFLNSRVNQVVPKLATVVTVNLPEGLVFLSPKVVSTSLSFEITSEQS